MRLELRILRTLGFIAVVGAIVFGTSVKVLRADDTAADSGVPAEVAAPASGDSNGDLVAAQSSVKKRKKGRGGPREKDAEGTEAPNRFEADPVIKSPYKLGGQPLEVDTD